MAHLNLILTATPKPAFYALLDVAQAIAECDGVEAAEAWTMRALGVDFDLFYSMRADDRPKLRLIEGGRA